MANGSGTLPSIDQFKDLGIDLVLGSKAFEGQDRIDGWLKYGWHVSFIRIASSGS